MAHAIRPSFASAITAIGGFKNRTALTTEQSGFVTEIERRLRRLDDCVGALIDANNKLIDDTIPKATHDPATDILTIEVPGGPKVQFKINRANPDVPATIAGSASTGTYHAGVNPRGGEAQDALERRFEDLSEHFYYSAHRILKLVQKLPGLHKFECRQIKIVRNKLVEHPEAGDPYSFGYGTNGPTIRPVARIGREWRDDGLVVNCIAFDADLVQAFSKPANTLKR